MESMTFAKALTRILSGNKLARRGWNRDGMAVVHVTRHSNIGEHLRLCFDANDPGVGALWLPAQTDMLADDWYLVGDLVGDQSPMGYFAGALNHLLDGGRATRAGWHGAGQFIFLVPGSTFHVNRHPLLGIYPEGTEINYHPHIDMKLVDQDGATNRVVPWTATTTDLMSHDWELLPKEHQA